MAKIYYESELKELAGRKYSTLEEVEEAEAKVSAEIARKQEAAALKKAEAKIVSDAIENYYTTKAAVKAAKTEAYKVYLQACQEQDKILEEAEAEEIKKLKEFCEKHPEGFHETINIAGIDTRFDYQTTENSVKQFYSAFDRFFNTMWK